MATTQNFDGKIIIIPGVYSNIKSGLKNIPNSLAYGDLLIIDTGSGAGCGGGAGINGTNTSGKDALYEFDNIDDFRDFVEKGIWWQLAAPLFKPNGSDSIGVSKISYVKAATTAPAFATLQAYVDSSDSSNLGGGSLKIEYRSEGLIGNAAKNNLGELSRGPAFKVVRGTRDTNKFVLKLYRGTYRGVDQNGLPLDGILEVDSKAELLVQSKEFRDFETLANWMKTSASFNKYFRYNESGSTVNGSAFIDASILGTYSTYKLFAGGTETYTSGNITSAFEIVKDLPCDFVFADKWGSNDQHAYNVLIHDFIKNESKFKPQLYVASGSLQSEFNDSLDTAAFYDSQIASVVHGGAKIASRTSGSGFRTFDSYLEAAFLLGREAGIAPQVPMTFKTIAVDGVTHSMTETEKTKALQGGLLTIVSAEGARFECLKGVNSLQDNEDLLNANSTTHSKQLYRIAHQLNKEILITAKSELLNNPDGVNKNTLSVQDAINWTKNFLTRKLASPTSDNLILSFQDITAKSQNDGYYITYAFKANSEISFLFFTGFMLDVN